MRIGICKGIFWNKVERCLLAEAPGKHGMYKSGYINNLGNSYPSLLFEIKSILIANDSRICYIPAINLKIIFYFLFYKIIK